MSKKKVYYAHFMGIYDTPQEERDIKFLEDLGFEVINPNTISTSNKFKNLLKSRGEENYLIAFNETFGYLVRKSDLVAFRSLPDGSISSGVVLELEYAQDANKPIIELPSGLSRRKLTPEQTREALREFGKR